MSSRKRKTATPRHVNGGDSEKVFTFVQASMDADVAFCTSEPVQCRVRLPEVAAAERVQRDDAEAAPRGAVSPPPGTKRPRLSPEDENESPPPSPVSERSVFHQFLTLPITLLPPLCDQPARAVPLLTSNPQTLVSSSGSALPIPVGQLAITLENDVALEAFFSLTGSNASVKSSLIWLSSGEQLLKLETTLEQVFLPAAVQPSLDYSTAVEALYGLVGRMRYSRLILSSRRRERGKEEKTPGFVAMVWAMEKLLELQYPSELPRNGKILKHSRNLVRGLYPQLGSAEEGQESVPTGEQGTQVGVRRRAAAGQRVREKIQQFYKDVQQSRRRKFGEDLPLDTPTIPGLTAELRNYQSKAVAWMLEREKEEGEEGEGQRPLHTFWRELPTMLDRPVYFNFQTGKFSSKRFEAPPWPRGGILADEMGLGKTVEVLALIMAHKCPREDGRETREGGMEDEGKGVEEEKPGKEEDAQARDKVALLEAVKSTSPPGCNPRDQECNQLSLSVESPVTVGSGTGSNATASEFTAMDQEPPNLPTDPPKGTSLDVDPGVKEEVIRCLCGATTEVEGAEYVQCERCLVWQHSSCAKFVSSWQSTFICIKCCLEEPLPSGTTLIISPQSIVHQWIEEIGRHTESGALNVLHYKGVSQVYVSPFELASYDIVLVTYETLRSEVNHAISHEVSWRLRFRKGKRYCVIPSPLPAVRWWRVCLDEAQMVESVNAKAAEMTQKLSAVNRWCVTGTPVQRDLHDLYGLVVFLGVDPFFEFGWYNRLVWQPFLHGQEGPMLSLFAKLMWRNSKADVADELQLPAQSEELHWLGFTPAEAFFYQKQQSACAADAAKVLVSVPGGNHALSNLMQSTVHKLMAPLHRLRQACCHPQIVTGSYIPVNTSKRNCVTMTQLLEKLTKHSKVEATEALRQLVAALNGQAGIWIIKEEWETAVAVYREAMSAWQEHEEHMECDKIQRIHTMENLAELLRADHGGETHTLRDDSLREEAQRLRKAYVAKPEGLVRATLEALMDFQRNTEKTKTEANCAQAEYLCELPTDLVGHDSAGSGQVTGPSSQNSNAGQSGATSSQDNAALQDSTDTAGQDSAGSGQDKEGANLSYSDEGAACGKETGSCSEVACPVGQEGSTSSSYSSHLSGESGLRGQEETKEEEDSVERIEEEGCSGANQSPVGEGEGEEGMGTESNSSSESSREARRKLVTPSLPWWVSVIEWAVAHKTSLELVDNVNAELSAYTSSTPMSVSAFVTIHDEAGLQFVIASYMDKIESLRQTVLRSLLPLSSPPSDSQVREAAACHLRRGREDYLDIGTCEMCRAEDVVVQYGHRLFIDYMHQEEVELRSTGQGSRRIGLFEVALKSISAFARRRRAPRALQKASQAYLGYVDALRREYEGMRALWIAEGERIGACDELLMSSTRLRVMNTHEMLLAYLDMDIPFIVHPLEVNYKIHELEADKMLARSELSKCLGQLLYLKNLAKTQDLRGPNMEICPVCTTQLGMEWAVFPCGHPLCMDCTFTMVRLRRQRFPPEYGQDSRRVTIKCPLCRLPSLSTEISYVTAQGDSSDMPIKGSHSTKIIGVTRLLLRIQQEDPGAKSLVFSSWQDILKLIARSLEDNAIKYSFLKTGKTFQDNLSEFKKSPFVNVLLLPIHSGSKGLNIVEATHVLFVEPLLNVGSELQAIGRVHRMGQTKATTVHRLYVKHTVEERIHGLLNSHTDRSNFLVSGTVEEGELMTVTDLQKLLQD